MDIGYVIRHVRILRYFLKTVLDKDQRILLKLKSTEFIPSTDDGMVNHGRVKKGKNKDLILRRYVEVLQKKTFGKMDMRLLQVLGFKDVLRILTEEKSKQTEHEERMNKFFENQELNNGNKESRNGISKRNERGLADESRDAWNTSLDKRLIYHKDKGEGNDSDEVSDQNNPSFLND